jgi:hypothetical protein
MALGRIKGNKVIYKPPRDRDRFSKYDGALLQPNEYSSTSSYANIQG